MLLSSSPSVPWTARERGLLVLAAMNGLIAAAMLTRGGSYGAPLVDAAPTHGSGYHGLYASSLAAVMLGGHGGSYATPLVDAAPTHGSGYHGLYASSLGDAKYIDLTHTISPDMPIWAAFDKDKLSFGPAIAGSDGGMGEDFIQRGDEFMYRKQGFIATSVTLPTDQLGTQLDAPAHWNEYGATVSDLPPTMSLRPLVVINIAPKVAASPGYHAQVEDVLAWEAAHGRVPAGSIVFFRSDYWGDAWPSEPAPLPGVGLEALKLLHEERHVLFHGHEPLDTDTTPSLEGEAWLMHHDYTQAEGVANLHLVPETGCLLSVGFPKIAGGTGGYARYVAICPPDTPAGVTVADAPGAPLPRQSAPLRRGADGVLAPSPEATPTDYCQAVYPRSLGCPPAE